MRSCDFGRGVMSSDRAHGCVLSSAGWCSRSGRHGPGAVGGDQFRVTDQLALDRLAAVQHLELAILDGQEPIAARFWRLSEGVVTNLKRQTGQAGRVVLAEIAD